MRAGPRHHSCRGGGEPSDTSEKATFKGATATIKNPADWGDPLEHSNG